VGAAVAAPLDTEGVGRLALADVSLLGETHDNPLHHNAQARIVAEIAPRALVFEMIPEDLARTLTPDIRADEEKLGAYLDWEARGWPDFAMYWPVFAAAPEAAIFGADVPRADLERAMDEGAAAAMGDWAVLFGLDIPGETAEQSEREDGMAASHCNALPRDVLPRMVEAQRVRDAFLARAVLAAHAETGGPVAVITGNGHARTDWGVPALLAEAAPDLDVVALGQFETDPTGPQPFDFWTVAPPPDRADPCAAFR